jgi:site-specific recombinase XerD
MGCPLTPNPKEIDMGQLRDKMEADLKIGGYSPSTRKIYLLYARSFVAYFRRSPETMGTDEVRVYLLHLVEDKKASRETIRQVRSALRFLYTVTLNQPLVVEHLPVPRRTKRVATVLSGQEVSALLAAVRNLKYRMIFSAMYGSGLRIAEACTLRPACIDSQRGVIRVCGKGQKERYTLLSRRLLRELRDYWRQTRPEGGWLFPGRPCDRPIGTESARQVFRRAVQDAGIGKKVTPHVLRHSFATHLIDAGTDVTVVQALLGHELLCTTMLYTHSSIRRIARTGSPLDLLGTPEGAILG